MRRETMRKVRYVLATAAFFSMPELLYWAGVKACPPPIPAKGCGVLVLGFPARRDGSPHPLQRHRVTTGVEVMRKAGCRIMLLSGGSPHTPHGEAGVMAALARDEGIPNEQLIMEDQSRNTWENISHSLRYMEAWETIYLVSDGLHVHRATRYLCRQRPELCARARPAARYRLGELYGLKWLGVLHETRTVVVDLFRR